MYTIKLPQGRVDISKDLFRTRLKFTKELIFGSREKESAFLGQLEIELEAVAHYLGRQGYPEPKKARMLVAHGYVNRDPWYYLDRHGRHATARSIDEWVDHHQHNYDALYIHACNNPDKPHHLKPRACFLVYPLAHCNNLAFIHLIMHAKIPLAIVPPKDYTPSASPPETAYPGIQLLREVLLESELAK